MEQKKINLSILFINIVFAIGVAFRSLINFFNGVGIAFVACLIIGGLGLAYGITKKENRRYLYDMFIMLGLVMIIQLIIFCSFVQRYKMFLIYANKRGYKTLFI